MTDLVPVEPRPLLPTPTISPELLAGQLAASSIAMYRRDWAAYTAWCQDAACAPAVPASLARWRAHLAGETTLAPNTINRMLSAVKRVAKEAHAQGFLAADEAAAFATVQGVKALALKARSRAHSRTRIEPADMRRLCDAPDRSTLKGLRDAALLATLASSGVRVSEAVSLQLGNILHRKSGYLVTVLGKTDVEPREAPLSREAYGLIQEWIKARPVMSPSVFTGFGGRSDRGARATADPITAAAAWQIVQAYAKAVDLEHIKVHDFRRFVGTQLATKDIRKAQKALGHKNIQTTARHYVLDELETGLTDELY